MTEVEYLKKRLALAEACIADVQDDVCNMIPGSDPDLRIDQYDADSEKLRKEYESSKEDQTCGPCLYATKNVTPAIRRFEGDNFFLSNFCPASIDIAGLRFGSSEAAFQAMKCERPEDRLQFAGLSPSQAKSLGRKVNLREDWEDIKDLCMLYIVRWKFTQHEDLGKKLLDTGMVYLEEGNTWHDNYWGVCSCDKCKNIQGKNKLGRTLMLVRDELREIKKKENQSE